MHLRFKIALIVLVPALTIFIWSTVNNYIFGLRDIIYFILSDQLTILTLRNDIYQTKMNGKALQFEFQQQQVSGIFNTMKSINLTDTSAYNKMKVLVKYYLKNGETMDFDRNTPNQQESNNSNSSALIYINPSLQNNIVNGSVSDLNIRLKLFSNLSNSTNLSMIHTQPMRQFMDRLDFFNKSFALLDPLAEKVVYLNDSKILISNFSKFFDMNQTSVPAFTYSFRVRSCPENVSSQVLYLKTDKVSYGAVWYSCFGFCSNPTDLFLILKTDFILQIDTQLLYQLLMMIGIQWLVFIVFLFYIWRKSMVVGLSFELPLKQLIEILQLGYKSLEIEDLTLENYEEFFNSYEMDKLYVSMINFINNLKYSNNNYWNIDNPDASVLINQCRSKQFYQSYNNLAAVGICASNISRIHLQNKRYLEAFNEQEESLWIGNQEIQGIKEYKEFILTLANKSESRNLLQIINQFKYKLTQKFRRMDDQWLKNFFKDNKSKRARNASSIMTTVPRSTTVRPSKEPITFFRTNRSTTQSQKAQQNLINGPDYNFNFDPARSISNARKIDDFSNTVDQHNITTPQNLMSISQPNPPLLLTEIREASEKKCEEEEGNEIINKLLEIKREKKLAKKKILYRRYQLACILFEYTLKREELFMQESIQLFTEIYDMILKLKEASPSILNMQINILCKKAICLCKASQMEEAQRCHDMAKQHLNTLRVTNLVEMEDLNFMDIFKGLPIEIQEERILVVQGIIQMVNSNYRVAAETFLRILEGEAYQDHYTQSTAYYHLKHIFNLLGLPDHDLNVYRRSQAHKNLQIVAMIDYTSQMNAEQLILSHSMVKFLIDQLDYKDQIGLYAYNEVVYQIFPVQNKGHYRDLMELATKSLFQYPGGSCNIFKVLQQAATYLFETGLSSQRKKLINQSKKLLSLHKNRQISRFLTERSINLTSRSVMSNLHNSCDEIKEPTATKPQGDQIDSCIEDIFVDEEFKKATIENIEQEQEDHTKMKYICLFANGIQNYNQEQFNALQQVLLKKRINLIVFNIANQNQNMLYLKLLSSITSESKFLTTDEEIRDFFKVFSQSNQIKKYYIEFF